MLTMILIGFAAGLCVPFVASRFGKYLPSDPGTALSQMWHRPRFPKGLSATHRLRFRQMWTKLGMISLLWGGISAGAAALIGIYFPPSAHVWLMFFWLILAVLTAIDERYFLLPDVLTIPLLLLGLAYSLWGNGIPIETSLAGALYGYLLPSVSVLIVSPFLKDSFGGGDVKMLAALGAWFGMIPLSVLLLISVVSFVLWAVFTKQRAGAYGPHLALAAMITLFLVQMKALTFL